MKSKSGFTIVELLIVIVVIGILAAIVVVAYNGVQQKALTSALAAETDSVTKKLELYKVADNDIYPTSISACPTPGANELCLPVPDDRQLQYQSSLDSTGKSSYSISLNSDKQFLYTSTAEKTSSGNEFMRYANLAPYIDRYGLTKYQVSFDIKSADTSNRSLMQVYFQNGSGTRYGGLQTNVDVSTEFQHYQLEWTATDSNTSLTEAWLAFYGSYGTGNRPIVKNVEVKLAP